MKVLLRKNVAKLGKIGDVIEVTPGYARNYLLPQGIALKPSQANLRTIEIEKQRYLQQLAKEQSELAARATLVDGKEITIPARANPEGHLYGSVGPAQIVAALAAENVFIEPENVVLDAPIRTIDKYDLTVRFAETVTATIHVWIVPIAEEDEEAPLPDAEPGDQPEPTDAQAIEPTEPADRENPPADAEDA